MQFSRCKYLPAHLAGPFLGPGSPCPPGESYFGPSARSIGATAALSRGKTNWWRRPGSNRRPSRCKRDALPAELRPPLGLLSVTPPLAIDCRMVAPAGIEPATSPLSGARSNRLSYRAPERYRAPGSPSSNDSHGPEALPSAPRPRHCTLSFKVRCGNEKPEGFVPSGSLARHRRENYSQCKPQLRTPTANAD